MCTYIYIHRNIASIARVFPLACGSGPGLARKCSRLRHWSCKVPVSGKGGIWEACNTYFEIVPLSYLLKRNIQNSPTCTIKRWKPDAKRGPDRCVAAMAGKEAEAVAAIAEKCGAQLLLLLLLLRYSTSFENPLLRR